MCSAYHLQMTAKQGYVWFLPQWFASDWYDTDKLDMSDEFVMIPKGNGENGNGNGHRKKKVTCTTAQMIEVEPLEI